MSNMTDKGQLELDIKFIESVLLECRTDSFKHFNIDLNSKAIKALDKFKQIAEAACMYMDV